MMMMKIIITVMMIMAVISFYNLDAYQSCMNTLDSQHQYVKKTNKYDP